MIKRVAVLVVGVFLLGVPSAQASHTTTCDDSGLTFDSYPHLTFGPDDWTDANGNRTCLDPWQGNDDVRLGDKADMVVANGGDDTIKGGDNADDLYGGQGDDRIYGGGGSDYLNGGGDDDVFYDGSNPGGSPDAVDGVSGYDILFHCPGGGDIILNIDAVVNDPAYC